MHMNCLCLSSLTVLNTRQPVNFGIFTCEPKMNLFTEAIMMMMRKMDTMQTTTPGGRLRMR